MAHSVIDHAFARHYLTLLRNKQTAPEAYRIITRRLSVLLALEASRDLETVPCQVETPVERTQGELLSRPIALVPILRAGLAMLDAIIDLFTDVAVGYVGLERHHDTAIARSYYQKMPGLHGRACFCLDPMLATGGSASRAISMMVAHGAESPVMLSIIAAPEGIARLENDHPNIRIFCCAIDRELNDRKYIVPGLGDFGDRLYGTM